MKKNITLSILGWFFASMFGQAIYAQVEKIEKEEIIVKDGNATKNQKETQELIIRKKGNKDTKLTLEITGSKVLVNGKPMAEFSEDGITINNRKMIIRDGNKITMDFNDDITRMNENRTRLNDERTHMNEDRNRMLDEMDDLDNIEPNGIKEITIDKLGNFKFDGFGDSNKTRPFLGVGTEKNKEGAKIMNIEKASPAEKAGLKLDDIIYKVNDKNIDGMVALSEVITSMKVGAKATVYFVRDGKKQQVDATIGERKNRFTTNKTFTYVMPNGKIRSLKVPRVPRIPNKAWQKDFDLQGDFNFNNNDYFNFRKPKLGLKIQDTEEGNGVKILEIEAESTSAKAGLLKDDVLIEIAGKKITNTDEAREELKENKENNSYNIKIKRDGKEMEFSIKIPKKLKTVEL